MRQRFLIGLFWPLAGPIGLFWPLTGPGAGTLPSAHARKPPLVSNAPVLTSRYWVVRLRLRGEAVRILSSRARVTRLDKPMRLYAMSGPYRLVVLGDAGQVLAQHHVSFPLLGLGDDDARFRAGLRAENEVKVPDADGLRGFRIEDARGNKLDERAARWPAKLRAPAPPASTTEDDD